MRQVATQVKIFLFNFLPCILAHCILGVMPNLRVTKDREEETAWISSSVIKKISFNKQEKWKYVETLHINWAIHLDYVHLDLLPRHNMKKVLHSLTYIIFN